MHPQLSVSLNSPMRYRLNCYGVFLCSWLSHKGLSGSFICLDTFDIDCSKAGAANVNGLIARKKKEDIGDTFLIYIQLSTFKYATMFQREMNSFRQSVDCKRKSVLLQFRNLFLSNVLQGLRYALAACTRLETLSIC